MIRGIGGICCKFDDNHSLKMLKYPANTEISLKEQIVICQADNIVENYKNIYINTTNNRG